LTIALEIGAGSRHGALGIALRRGHPVPMVQAFRAEAHAITDAGPVRQHNEDHFGSFPEEGLYLVADGMGGHSSGEPASRLAVDQMGAFFKETARDPASPWSFKMDRTRSYEENRLCTAMRVANRCIVQKGQEDRSWRGMGTTIAAVSVTGGEAQIAHVGDSRVYRLRGGALEPLTRDHTLINDYRTLKSDLTAEEIAELPQNVITRAVGMKDELAVDVRTEEIQEGDLYLVSTDGLHGALEDQEIAGILCAHAALDVAVRQLIQTAIQRGTSDNVTALLLRLTAR
jgi:serine/threonine protein phosphatase PrpC